MLMKLLPIVAMLSLPVACKTSSEGSRIKSEGNQQSYKLVGTIDLATPVQPDQERSATQLFKLTCADGSLQKVSMQEFESDRICE